MSISPMMKHYLQIKEKYNDAIVLYRLGDFYEMFFEDAEEISQVLNLTLTKKSCGLKDKAPMCGIPAKSLDVYVKKLIDTGYKVAICEQLSEPVKGKIVDRDVIRVITPGTVIEENMLEDKKNNYLLSIFKSVNKIGVAYADVSTGEFNVIDLANSTNYLSKINDILTMLQPSEIICNEEMYLESNDLESVKQGVVPKFYKYFDWAFDHKRSLEKLKEHFNTSTLQIFDLDNKNISISAAGAMIEYLNETQKRVLEHISNIQLVKDTNYMYLDINARRNLEIIETMRDKKKKGSLLWVLDQTKTSMGGRKLRNWLERPLQDVSQINQRLDGVSEIKDSVILRDSIIEQLRQINDIERLSSKIIYKTITPRDCITLKSSLNKLPEIKRVLSDTNTEILKNINDAMSDFSGMVNLIEKSIVAESPMSTKDGGFIKPGFSRELDDIKSISKNAKKWVANLETDEKKKTGIKNLKIGFNKVFGYYIEISNSQKHMAPEHYQRRQTLTGGERYITPELKEIEEKILNSQERSLKLEMDLFNDIREKLRQGVSDLQKVSESISQLDTLTSFAFVAADNNYCRPEMIDDDKLPIKIENGRHPVVEKIMGQSSYVANNTDLNTLENRTMLITGPNMAGKSTYMRQVAIITLMAHIGSFVPASSALISITDRIFTRVGATDDLTSNQSTFMVEMMEMSNILHNATNSSLIILDEVGRGTATYDGLSIAYSIIDYLSNNFNVKTLFSTHYHELTELEEQVPGVKNYKITVKEFNENILFLYKIVHGKANKSFGIDVAKLAGLPDDVTRKAKQVLFNIEKQSISINNNHGNSLKEAPIDKLSEADVISIIKNTDVDELTPIEALNVLKDLTEKLKEKSDE